MHVLQAFHRRVMSLHWCWTHCMMQRNKYEANSRLQRHTEAKHTSSNIDNSSNRQTLLRHQPLEMSSDCARLIAQMTQHTIRAHPAPWPHTQLRTLDR